MRKRKQNLTRVIPRVIQDGTRDSWAANIGRIFRAALLLLIGAYRTIGTTHLGGSCRFEPSCSEYALQASRIHPPQTAIKLIASRVFRCRPGGTYGFDPVPQPKLRKLAPPQFSFAPKELT